MEFKLNGNTISYEGDPENAPYELFKDVEDIISQKTDVRLKEFVAAVPF